MIKLKIHFPTQKYMFNVVFFKVVLAGDLYQLRSVPNVAYNDPGHLIISAKNFKDIVPHVYELDQVYRQNEGVYKMENNSYESTYYSIFNAFNLSVAYLNMK